MNIGPTEIIVCLLPIFIVAAVVAVSRYALAAQPDKTSAEQTKATRGELKRCPYCAELIQPAAIVCRYCGRDMPTVANQTAHSPREPEK